MVMHSFHCVVIWFIVQSLSKQISKNWRLFIRHLYLRVSYSTSIGLLLPKYAFNALSFHLHCIISILRNTVLALHRKTINVP